MTSTPSPKWIIDLAEPAAAAGKLPEIEAAIATLKTTSHKGSVRGEIAICLRVVPTGRKKFTLSQNDLKKLLDPRGECWRAANKE